MPSCDRLPRSFYDVPCEDLARKMLGKVLCRDGPAGVTLKARVVETEVYPGGDDRASHSYQGKKTERNRAMFAEPGTAYVYMTYGMYFCFNVSSRGEGAAVLLRALQPVAGASAMQENRRRRTRSKKAGAKDVKEDKLCNGPAKLCQAFGIERDNVNMTDMADDGADLWLEDDGEAVDGGDVVVATRVGIDGAGEESAKAPFRFYIRGNPCVSVVDKTK